MTDAAVRNPFEPVPDRRRVAFAGRIVFNNKSSVFDCMVTELSSRGATLKVVSALGIPRRFHLELRELRQSFLCDVATRSLQEITVEFVHGVVAGAAAR